MADKKSYNSATKSHIIRPLFNIEAHNFTPTSITTKSIATPVMRSLQLVVDIYQVQIDGKNAASGEFQSKLK